MSNAGQQRLWMEVVRIDMEKCNVPKDLAKIDRNGKTESCRRTQHS